MCVCMWVCVCAYVFVWVWVCMHTCVCAVCERVCVYMCARVCCSTFWLLSPCSSLISIPPHPSTPTPHTKPLSPFLWAAHHSFTLRSLLKVVKGPMGLLADQVPHENGKAVNIAMRGARPGQLLKPQQLWGCPREFCKTVRESNIQFLPCCRSCRRSRASQEDDPMSACLGKLTSSIWRPWRK